MSVEHSGIDRLADYRMTLAPDSRKVANPAWVAARKTVAAVQARLVAAERALPQLLTDGGSPKQMNDAMPQLQPKRGSRSTSTPTSSTRTSTARSRATYSTKAARSTAAASASS